MFGPGRETDAGRLASPNPNPGPGLALLVTPHRFYWEATLFAVEAAVALKAFTLVMRTASQGSRSGRCPGFR